MYRKIALVIFIGLFLWSCASVMMKVGQLAQSALTIKTAQISDATPMVKLYNNKRPYPITNTMKNYAKSKGFEVSDGFPSSVTLMLTKGMKFVELDGTVLCNGKEMKYYGAGMYILKTPVKSGSKFTFELKGSGQKAVRFTRTYHGQKISLLAPKKGQKLDLSKGFTVKWTKGNDPEKAVKISLIVTQMGLENIVPVAVFPDVGQAQITPQMLGELKAPGQKIKTGENYVIIERQKDEIFYELNGDGISSSIDADAAAVIFTESPPDPVRPVVESFKVKQGDIELTVSECATRYNPYAGMIVPVNQIRSVALSSFVLKGFTSGTKKTKAGKVTTTYSYWADLGRDNLQNVVNIMAANFLQQVATALNSEQVSIPQILQTRGYQKMRQVESKSDVHAFYVTANNLTSFEGLHQLQFKIGGIESWYYDIAKSSGADALMEVYLTLHRQKPKHSHEFTFDITASVVNKVYPYNIIMRCGFPSVEAKWKSDSFELQGNHFDAGQFLRAIKFDQFVKTYLMALEQLKQKESQLTI